MKESVDGTMGADGGSLARAMRSGSMLRGGAVFRIGVFAALVFLAAVPITWSHGAGVIASMDEIRFAPPREKGSASLVDGRVGRAIRFRLETDAASTFFTSNIHGKPEWDRAQGFSFWVRGNGSDGFGGLEFIYDDDYAVRYDVCFPVKNGEWRKISVAWQDLVPVLPGPAAKPLGTSRGNAASKLSAVFVGKWWYWALYPALCFDIDEIRLEPTIERDANDYLPDGPPLGRVLAKLKAGNLSKAGHAIVAETVIKAIEQEQNPKEKATVTKRSAAP